MYGAVKWDAGSALVAAARLGILHVSMRCDDTAPSLRWLAHCVCYFNVAPRNRYCPEQPPPLPSRVTTFIMALPVVSTLADCADFSKTVEPFIPQLRSLSQHLLQAWAEPQRIKDLYLSTNPLISAFALSLFLFPIFLLVSEVNKNYSQVDRMWSILPTVYNAHYAIWARLQGIPAQRLDTLLVFSAVWSVGFA